MAIGSYIRGGASAVKKGISTVGSYMLKPVDRFIEQDRAAQAARRENERKMIVRNFGSVERYEAQRKETEAVIKKRLEDKQKGTPASSYVKKR